MPLPKKIVDEINTHLVTLPWNKAVKVMVKDEPHCICYVGDEKISFFDEGEMEGSLEEMEFTNESKDCIKIDDMTVSELEKFVQDVLNPENIIDIVILVTDVDSDDDVPENIITDESILVGKIVEKQLSYQQEYIAIIEYSQEDIRWRVVSYHPKVMQERENAHVWSIINTITACLDSIKSSHNPQIILDRAEYHFEPVQINMLGVIYNFVDADIFRDKPIIRLENTENHTVAYYPTTKEWLEEYKNSLLAYITVKNGVFDRYRKEL